MSTEAFRPEQNDIERYLAAMAECSAGMAEAADIITAAQARHEEFLRNRIRLSEELRQHVLAECGGDYDWANWRLHELQTRFYADSPVAGEEPARPHLRVVDE